MKKLTIELRDCDYDYMRQIYGDITESKIEEMVRLALREEILSFPNEVPKGMSWYLNAMKNDSNFFYGTTGAENQEQYKEWNRINFDDL